MAQNIILKVAGREFPLDASTPDQERLMRLAAEDVDKILASYHEKYAGNSLEDKIALVAVAEAGLKITHYGRQNKLEKEIAQLKDELDAYLAGIETPPVPRAES